MEQAGQQSQTTHPTKRRVVRGSTRAEFRNWPDLDFVDMDSNLPTQQYLQQTIRQNPQNVDAICRCPPSQDSVSWQYEHLRQFVLELNQLIPALLADDCNANTCPVMQATKEWIFLCAAHTTTQPQECCAIDYITHTLDHACATLTTLPRITMSGAGAQNALKTFKNVARRLYRVFAHPFFHHQAVFAKFESETRLCQRFVHFALMYDLVERKAMMIPLVGTSSVPAMPPSNTPTSTNINTNTNTLPSSSSSSTNVNGNATGSGGAVQQGIGSQQQQQQHLSRTVVSVQNLLG